MATRIVACVVVVGGDITSAAAPTPTPATAPATATEE